MKHHACPLWVLPYANVVPAGRRRFSLAQTDSLLMRMRSVASDELHQMMQRRMSQENPIRASETEFVQRLQRLVVLAVNRLIYHGSGLALVFFFFSPSPKKSINETRRLTHLLSEQIPPFRCESGSIRPAKYSRLSRPTAFLSRARRSATRWKRLRLCPSFSHSLHSTARQQEKLSKRHPQAHDGRDKNQPGMTTLTREHFSLLWKIKQLRHSALFQWIPQGSTGRGGAPHHQWRRILWSCRDTFRVQIGRLLVHTLSPGLPLSDRKEALEFVFDARHLDILKESLSPGLEVRQSATV